MAEYIERGAALNAINANKSSTELAWITVSKITAADVAPVVHGHWVYGEFDIPHCSECGEEVKPDTISPFCHNCGAKMCEED